MDDIFDYNIDISKNAYLNWRIDKNDQAYNLWVLAEGFANAAVIMMDAILEDNKDKKADSIIMPILYSIDQSIEVYMKSIIRLIEELNGEQICNYTSHDIADLKNIMVSKIEKKETKTKGLKKHLSPVTEYIDELYARIRTRDEKGRTIANIDFARYPMDVDGKPHFYVAASDNVVINVENLKGKFIAIRKSLCGIYMMYEAEKENKNETL